MYLCLLKGKTETYPQFAIHSLIQLQYNILGSVLPGVYKHLGQDSWMLTRTVISRFSACIEEIHPLTVASSQDASIAENIKGLFCKWMTKGEFVADNAILSLKEPFTCRRLDLQRELGLQMVKVSDMLDIVNSVTEADDSCQLMSLIDLIKFWDKYFPISPPSNFDRIKVLTDVFIVFSKSYQSPDGSCSDYVDLKTVATFACILLDSDVTAFVDFVLELNWSDGEPFTVQGVLDLFTFLANSTIIIECCFFLDVIRRSDLPLIPATEFDPFFAACLQGMAFDWNSSIERLDLLHILLDSPALFLPLTSQFFPFSPLHVEKSKYLQIMKILQTKRKTLESFYNSFCETANQTKRVIYKGDFYQAMHFQEMNSKDNTLFFDVINIMWSQAMKDRDMVEGCNPIELLKNLSALFFADERLLWMYSSLAYNIDGGEWWSYNDVFDFFDLIYHLYDRIIPFSFCLQNEFIVVRATDTTIQILAENQTRRCFERKNANYFSHLTWDELHAYLKEVPFFIPTVTVDFTAFSHS